MVKFPTKLEELLPPQAISKVLDLLSQPTLTNAVRDTLQKVGIRDGNPVGQVQDAWRQARGWIESVVDRVMEQNHASPAAINATGRLFNARWSSLPANTVATQAFLASAISFQDHIQLEQYAARTAAAALGSQAASFTTTCAAALGLLTRCEAFQGGLVIARTDVLRIPGSTDVRAVLEAGTNKFVDVGAVNGAAPEDWQSALTSSSQTLVRVSPNGLEASDDQAQADAALARAREVGARVVDILFDATLDETLSSLGFPLMSTCLAAGSDLVIAPLDLLLGGPAGAVIAGREDLVNSLRATAISSGANLQGPLLASAAAVFARSSPSESSHQSSIALLLTTNIENLKDRARRLAVQLNNTVKITTAESQPATVRLGPSPWQQYQLDTHVVALTARDVSPEDLSRDLASGKSGTAIWTKIEEGRLLIDLRFVDPADDHKIVEAIVGVSAT